MRPVELQDALGKTQAVERIAQLQKANSENEQRQVIQNAAQKTQDVQRKPTPTAHPDEVVLHRDRDKDKEGRKKKQKPDEQADAAAALNAGTKTSPRDEDEPLPPPELDITV